MSTVQFQALIGVIGTSEARAALPSAVARFRTEGAFAAPLLFGAHRKPEAAIISYQLLELLLPHIESLYAQHLAGHADTSAASDQPPSVSPTPTPMTDVTTTAVAPAHVALARSPRQVNITQFDADPRLRPQPGAAEPEWFPV